MFSGSVRELLSQVIGSWQVLVVTVVLVIYISLVNYAARAKGRRRSPPVPKKRSKPAKNPEPVTGTDELGLEQDVTEE